MLKFKLRTFTTENVPQHSINIAYGGEDNVIPNVKFIERKGSRLCSVMIDEKMFVVVHTEYKSLVKTLIRARSE